MLRSVRYSLTAPLLQSLLPKKLTLNRILFDNNSRLSYTKALPVLEAVYTNIDLPEAIRLPKYVKSDDLMVFKNVLTTLRNTTNLINKRLVALENELVEQAAELGNNDAIAVLAFETVGKKLQNLPDILREDYQYANELIKQLTDLKHPLVFKLAGDLAFKQGHYLQAADYWGQFVELEPDTILASQVYANLGIYHFQYLPKPNLSTAKRYFEKSIALGELDKFTIQAHYYLGQMYVNTSPLTAKYHLEISASRGLKESFASLGFLELNVFCNLRKSIEWFQLGVEANQDVSCMIGQFDAYMKLRDFASAFEVSTKISSIRDKITAVRKKKVAVPPEMQHAMAVNEDLLAVFYKTRGNDLEVLPTML